MEQMNEMSGKERFAHFIKTMLEEIGWQGVEVTCEVTKECEGWTMEREYCVWAEAQVDRNLEYLLKNLDSLFKFVGFRDGKGGRKRITIEVNHHSNEGKVGCVVWEDADFSRDCVTVPRVLSVPFCPSDF